MEQQTQPQLNEAQRFQALMDERRAHALPSGTYPPLTQVEAPNVFDPEAQVTAVDLVNAGI